MPQINVADYDDDQRLRTDLATLFLGALLGFPIASKTLTNWRAKGYGPRPEYFGIIPLYRVRELKRFARDDAIQPINSRRRNRETRAIAHKTASAMETESAAE